MVRSSRCSRTNRKHNAHLAHTALIVRNYDEALAFYVGKLGFTLVADEVQPEQDKRWVMIHPPGAPENATTILLARASTSAIRRPVAYSCFSLRAISSATMPPSPPPASNGSDFRG
ncbi:MAG TPA: VOC family protein [Sphingomonas sp.]|nr:VOC family protein [Sphingomonas sp.]